MVSKYDQKTYIQLIPFQPSDLPPDPFTEYLPPGWDSCTAGIGAAGYQTKILPVIGAGRTLISKGYLAQAAGTFKAVQAIKRFDPEGLIPGLVLNHLRFIP
jgi:hypothetical protein